MSLRKALTLLPDDRATVNVTREAVAFFSAHPREPIEPERVYRALGMPAARVEPVLRALADSFVIDCDGDPRLDPCRFDPDSILQLEVNRFLRVKDTNQSRLQSGVDRYRGRYGGT